ncbi:hypothetical protein AMATHDRAFT_76123 [Amanita thiersii Skay4041]|uniref:Lysine-specific metallo-endopeptidase domain-containing protein n=1 Tax=Amanita thiersii Skay4041 TaxID=703135 RepID=A0A2A9NP92_9AGAR|nr:hypothetical protein AMATHDRAFT_76123 [Amanita thiersii Skay4041]
MFPTSLTSAVIALLLATNVVSAASDLHVKVTGPEVVHRVEDFVVITTVTNTGQETFKVLHDPISSLSDLPGDTFSIVGGHGVQPRFTGIRAKFVPHVAAESNGFTVLAPGQSLSVKHDIFRAYDFRSSGPGKYRIHPNNVFHAINECDETVIIYADIQHHIAKLSGTLAVTHPKAPTDVERNPKFSSCSSSQQAQIVTTIPVVQHYAKQAYNDLVSHMGDTSRYTTWFGRYDDHRHLTVQTHFNKIQSNDFSEYTYDCSCSRPGVFAYVYPGKFGKVYLCDAFWRAPINGTDSKAGTLIHESSHFLANGGTTDQVYGQSGAQNLALRDPESAIHNADSHEYFAENNPALE